MIKIKQFLLFIAALTLIIITSPFIFVINTVRYWSENYWFTVAIGLDQLGGCLLYNEEDWTISSFTYYLCYYKHKLCWFMKFINLIFGKEHCHRSFLKELNKMEEEALSLKDF